MNLTLNKLENYVPNKKLVLSIKNKNNIKIILKVLEKIDLYIFIILLIVYIIYIIIYFTKINSE